jgi:5-methylcytosine-specific restriction protein A
VPTEINKIDEARAFLRERVLLPALTSMTLEVKAKNTIRNSLQWIAHFRRIGDLVHYISRFAGGADTAVYLGLKAASLETFEDIRSEFLARFGAWQSDRTRLDDFIIGEAYDSYDLNIFAERYDNRSGGILPIGEVGHHRAVFVKATLEGGKYPNGWLEDGLRLQYYLKSVTVGGQVRFDEMHKLNRAIINYPDVPVYAFVRPMAADDFHLAGVFAFRRVHIDPNGGKWFDLLRRVSDVCGAISTDSSLREDLDKAVKQSLASSSEDRKRRLANAPVIPPQVTVIGKTFVRNADVIAEVLERARGLCEICGQPAPFARTTDGTPYLEVHHMLPLAYGGKDAVENAVATCPNCHRREHYGPARWPHPDD